MVAVDGAGRILAWRAIRGPGVRTSGTSSVASLEPVSLARDGRVPTTGARDVAWWSAGRFAASFDDGSVFVADAPSMRNALGDAAETFAGAPALAACPRRANSRHPSGVRDAGSVSARIAGSGSVAAASERVAVLETPAAEDPRLGRSRWRVATLGARSPAEMLRAHVDAEEWGVALRLARARGLDPDDVHKARWEASTPSREALTDSWAKISDRAWAAAKCAVAVAPTYEAQRVVLAHGLRETEKQIREDDVDETDVDDESNRGDLRGGSPSRPSRKWCWWTRLRLTLLAQLDRLDTLHAAHLGNYSPRAYASFRSADLGDATIAFAAAGNHIAAERVARRHPRAVAPRLLDVLEALPETASPANYAGLLPWSSPWRDSTAPTPTRGAREADRCETRDAVHALLAESRGEGRTVAEFAARAGVSAAAAAVSAATPPAAWLARATEPLVALGEAWRVAAEEEEGGAAGWARRRAARCDEEAGAIGAAAELLAAAAAAFHDDASLGAAARAAAELASAVYEADPPNPAHPSPPR